MQKSMKRLLSVLAVLALVLTMAPAGILAVETKADEIQSNLPAGIAELKAEAAAIQEAAKTALADGYCPVCDKPVEWVALPNGGTATGTYITEQNTHYVISGGYTSTASNFILFNNAPKDAVLCLLLDNANASVKGRILGYTANGTATLNIMGTGTITDTAAYSGYGLLSATSTVTTNLYGGTFVSTAATGLAKATIYVSNANAVTNIWTDDVVIGRSEVPTATSAASYSAYVASGTLNMYAGTIQNGKYNASDSSFPTYKPGNLSLGGTGVLNMYGGVIKNGYGSRGGNIYLNAGSKVNVYGGEIKNGYATVHGGNIHSNAKGGDIYLNGAVYGGTAASQGGNVYAYDGASLKLGNVDIYGGTAKGAALSNNIRIASSTNTSTLKLSGNAIVTTGVLMENTGAITVEPTFSGNVYMWHTGGVTMGGAVANSTATGGHTGHVYNGAWKSAVAANGASDVYIPVEMVWDGAAGLEYPTNGVVYNGHLRGAANSQAAVDAYVAAMADEELEEKPQYVYITEDVQLKDGAEVAIWAGADITVSGNGVVAGVDRKNDNYAANGATITVADQVTVAKEVTAGGRRYIALSDATVDANKYTFHRVETKLTNVTVNVANAGIYYKAEYQFDEIVKGRIASYGVLVKLNEDVTKDNYDALTSSDDVTNYADGTLLAKSHGVYGVFKDGKASNMEDGQIDLCGNPYLVINTTNDKEASDYPMFTADKSVNMSMADAMEMANAKWEQLADKDKTALNDFVNKWNAEGAWTAELLEKLTNFTIA